MARKALNHLGRAPLLQMVRLNGKFECQPKDARFFSLSALSNPHNFSEYIVMFDSYMDRHEMNATVIEIAGNGGYRIAPRFNPGASLPSDFAVIVVRFMLE